MFEKKEDKIFDLAFGELDAHEAQLFEASLLNDTESLAEIEFLRSMKEDLVSFRDIPEMQYSKERLRSAILGQGLKPKKPIMPWINWLLAPTAMACVAALGFVLVNGTSHKDTTYVGDHSKAMAILGPKPTIELPKNSTMVATNDTDDFPEATDYMLASIGSGRKAHSSRHAISRKEFKQVATSTPNKLSGSLPTGKGGNTGSIKDLNMMDRTLINNDVVAMSTSNDAFKVAFGNTSPQSSDDPKLIVIDKDQDSGVGAATATEVNSNGNVVVGG